MRYLIDTNVLIRVIEEYDVSKNTKSILEDYENIIYVSSESIKEFIHLLQNKKIKSLKQIRTPDLFDLIENILGFTIKYVDKSHLRTFARLDLVEGHNDPSDRLIISQALTEKLTLVSSDAKFPKYRKYGLNFIPNR
ncbi:MAG: type II toxin-antitoxin system VapC family toxin [Prevotellaceae bacterium]|jgi:PIN domain nuclease of toxin-antitoxin system|nr:type II toxin-antitoxin system VapC family toxin [Prevotellaceae bacterium]